MEKLKEHRIFRNQCIIMTFILFMGGGFLMMPLDFLSTDAIEGVVSLFGFGSIMALISIFNIFTYRENKKDFNKIYK